MSTPAFEQALIDGLLRAYDGRLLMVNIATPRWRRLCYYVSRRAFIPAAGLRIHIEARFLTSEYDDGDDDEDDLSVRWSSSCYNDILTVFLFNGDLWCTRDSDTECFNLYTMIHSA